MKSRWKIAQNAELDCWLTNKKKVCSPLYLDAKKQLWLEVISLLSKYFTIDDLQTKKILEFGCGPAGIFLLVKNNLNYVCLDPLMNNYLQYFPHIRHQRIKFLAEKVEDFDTKEQFNIILGFNALDHVNNIQDVLKILHKLSTQDAVIVLSVNVHNYTWSQFVLKVAYPVLDRLHKHQYTGSQYCKLFNQAGFFVIDKYNLDSSLNRFANSVSNLDENQGLQKRIFSPARIFFGWLKLFGLYRYNYERPESKSIYSAQCYVLKCNK